ncbi:carboxypeptidase inhibitor SmCI-like isoform X2 [Mytilus californianus]|uniref:carboxypeptidase inhibitor SmCI-like isoform X2 n=1 Tax=Mytilus californianus TaxID=6549 RepID=UPI002245677C|nr:carboxypeptidase inhibitor SmCI-like isoform X2 [Mytilus californianus]
MQLSLQLVFLFLVLIFGVISSDNICDLPKVVGSCRASIQRFHYDVQTGRCKRFFYGGCEGNNNNFKTRRDCVTACRKRVCTLPKLIGEGQSSIPRWFYNTKSMQCEGFIYGGRRGNRNNFRTKRRCERLCNGVMKDPCGPNPGCAPPPPDTCPGSSYEIINGEKCFTGCTYPKCKKGSCPSSQPLLPCGFRCNNDRQCTGDQLCCQQGCCRDPILEPKNGDCPKDPRPRNCTLRPSECNLDGQCDGRRKCCKFGCRKYCVDAEDQHEVIVIKNV